MNCATIEPLLAVRDELTYAQAQQVQVHLTTCAGCRARWQAINQARRVLQRLPVATSEPPARVATTLMPRFHRRAVRLPWMGRGGLVALAGVLALVVALSSVLLRADSPPSVGAPADAPAITPSAAAMRAASAVAYVQNGALWVVTLPDGEPVQLLPGGVRGWPHWSPSGDWLSVCTAERLTVLRADGSDTRELGPCNGRWLPSGDTLLVTDESGATRQWDLATGRAAPVTEPAGVWSPDGRQQVVVRQELLGTVDAANAPERTVSLWRMNRDGSDAVKLFSPGSPASYGLKLAGWVGDQILFWPVANFSESLLADGAPLQALPASGGTPRTLVPAMLTGESRLAFGPGEQLAVVAGGDRQSWTNKRIAMVDLANDVVRLLTPPEQAAVMPAWSPDGQQITYVAGPDVGPVGGGEPARAALAQRRIWTMRADGSEARVLTSDPVYRDELPHWTRDGQWLVFVRLDGQDRLSLWRMRPDGSELARIADDLGDDTTTDERWFGFYGTVDWSQLVAVR